MLKKAAGGIHQYIVAPCLLPQLANGFETMRIPNCNCALLVVVTLSSSTLQLSIFVPAPSCRSGRGIPPGYDRPSSLAVCMGVLHVDPHTGQLGLTGPGSRSSHALPTQPKLDKLGNVGFSTAVKSDQRIQICF